MKISDLTKIQREALNKIPDFSELYSCHTYRDCIEFVVKRWGDTCTFRVYNNGEVVEK